MITPKYFSLLVFLMFLATLETLQCNQISQMKKDQTRHLETNETNKANDQDSIKRLEDVFLAQKFPYMFGSGTNQDSGTPQINESQKRSFIIDGRPSKSQSNQMLIQEQKINVVIKSLNTKLVGIATVIKQLSIQKHQWNQDKGQFQSMVFGVDQLTIDKHNQFYSILLPILENGKYRIIIGWVQKDVKPLSFSIVYYLINLSKGNTYTLISNPIQPVDMSLIEDTLILPYGSTVSVPISSPNDVMMMELQSCSFSIPSIFYSFNDTTPSKMQELKDHDKKWTIFMIKNHRTSYNPSIYLKYIDSSQVYFHIQPTLEQGKIIKNQQFQQYMVKINKNIKSHFKTLFETTQSLSSKISYQIKGSDMQITYQKLYLNQNTILSYDQNHIKDKKIIYKLYFSYSESALAKKLLCGLDTYENGKNVIVMQKIVQQQNLLELIEKTKQKSSIQHEISSQIGVIQVSLWEIKRNLQNVDSQIYMNMKVAIITQNSLISSSISESQKQISQKDASSGDIFYYQPMKVKLTSSDFWLFLWEIKFSKLMWGFIIISLFILFILFFFQSTCKGWINRKKIPDESMSPRIVIKKPKKSLSDSYGFDSSPPSSSTNIIKIYEANASDQIIEDEQTQQKNDTRVEIIEQPSSPSTSV